MRYLLISLFFILNVFNAAQVRAEETFRELNGTHFIVRYTEVDKVSYARKVLAKAEQSYERVSRYIGFSRYSDFWTWEKRVRIVLFPDQISYSRFTGQATWSRGYASRDSRLFRDRTVVTFSGQSRLFEDIIPHEIAHLVLWDLLGDAARQAPVWLEEGIAQLAEEGKKDQVQSPMRSVVSAGNHIPFVLLQKMEPADLTQDQQVSLFYAQSLSIVVFLVEKYGQDSFYRLCKELRDGRSFETALRRVYGGIFDSIADLENRWLTYMSTAF